MIHLFEKGVNDKTLVLLHGDGGNEHDLLSVAHMIDPEANILSLRGNIIEYGMPRFYRRKSIGDVDHDSMVEQTHNIRDFIDDCAKTYRFNRDFVTVVGYSHGANIATCILFHFEKAFHKAILFHPMVPIRHIHLPNLNHTRVFIGAGHFDYLMPQHEVEELTQMFESANAEVEVFWTDYGHQLSKEEINAAKKWYKELEVFEDDEF